MDREPMQYFSWTRVRKHMLNTGIPNRIVPTHDSFPFHARHFQEISIMKSKCRKHLMETVANNKFEFKLASVSMT